MSKIVDEALQLKESVQNTRQACTKESDGCIVCERELFSVQCIACVNCRIVYKLSCCLRARPDMCTVHGQ